MQIVLSASRRTDIPAFYMPWFMRSIARGAFEVLHPFRREALSVAVSSRAVHSIVFWSKDFGPFLRDGCGERLERLGYHLYFQFTVNSEIPLLEPNVPPLGERLRQLGELCARFGPRAVSWRFDPICHFRLDGGGLRDNLSDFPRIADAAARAGAAGCTVSFMDAYPKIARRLRRRLPGLAFLDPGPEAQRGILLALERELAARGMRLATCCESALLEGLPSRSTIEAGACIPGGLLMELYGGRISLRRDPGQRRRAGCGCRVSVDIGSYGRHPCRHGCLYCYANPGGGA
jgi:hypothetical protein